MVVMWSDLSKSPSGFIELDRTPTTMITAYQSKNDKVN